MLFNTLNDETFVIVLVLTRARDAGIYHHMLVTRQRKEEP